ncbi:MAG TPA: DUF488 domain-containing protein [Acidobacteriota bacterium]|nr:DUF488 domain-containing protein [Acidobacteriota bacterium]
MAFDNKKTGGGKPFRQRRLRPHRAVPEKQEMLPAAVLYTVGMGRKKLQNLMQLLVDAGVQLVADVRAYAAESGPGFTRERDIAFLLKEVAGIEYRREEPLVPSREIREQFRRDHNWHRFEESYLEMLRSEKVEESLNPEIYAAVKTCLLGDPESAEQDHRRLAAEYLQQQWKIRRVEHL